MAPRRRYTMESDDLDSYAESSPDPLSASIISESNARPRRRLPRASNTPLASSSSNKQNRRESVTEHLMDFSSPSKSMVMNTGRPGGISPWRIKVTVEAEPGSGSDAENMLSPTPRSVARTRTTTVPLKDADSASPVKRRGRPRKSELTTSAKAKRTGTPVRKRSQSRGRSSSVDQFNASTAGLSVDVPPKKRRGRPRKSIPSNRENDEILVADESRIKEMPVIEPVSSTPEPEPEEDAFEVHKNPTPEPSIPVIQTTLATPQEPHEKLAPGSLLKMASLMPPEERIGRRRRTRETVEDIMFTPPQTDLSRRLRARPGTPHAKIVASSVDSSEEDDDVITPSSTDDDVAELSTRAPELESILINENIGEDELHDMTDCVFDEGTTRMPDDTTIIESENFSMVSFDSLPSLTSPLDDGPSGVSKSRSVELSPNLSQSSSKSADLNVLGVRNSPLQGAKVSSAMPKDAPTTTQTKSSPSIASTRQQTPLVDTRSPSNPPAIEPMQPDFSEAKTPKIGRVVEAGVALQDVVVPDRVTPTVQSSKRAIDERRDRLDDLFRGFSDRTRRDLQAGLRLGEQLAEQSQAPRHSLGQSSPVFSSPIKPAGLGAPTEKGFLARSTIGQSRLLTPEDNDEYSPPRPPPTEHAEVHYPSLRNEETSTHLVSPARSDDEMSWRVDTPPTNVESISIRRVAMTTHALRQGDSGIGNFTEPDNEERGEYSDVWHEEASRSSIDVDDGNVTRLEGLLAGDVLAKPARGKLPRTWRRTSANDFNYSDEAEEPAQETTHSSERHVDEPVHATRTDEGRDVNDPSTKDVDDHMMSIEGHGEHVGPPVVRDQYVEDEDDMSEASDDTGMFFQQNLPSIFNNKRSIGPRRRKADKVDQTTLLDQGESLLSDFSPAPKPTTTQHVNQHSFSNTPQRFPVLQSSPAKSSPLRHELKPSASASDDSYNQASVLDESSLPQSSPFHTNVEHTLVSTTSDQQQLRMEMDMEGATDSSLRHIREEVDAHANAYESQYRTLDEIEEVTEPSRTLKSTFVLPSSPPQAISESILKRNRAYSPLFGHSGLAASDLASMQHREGPIVRARNDAPVSEKEVSEVQHPAGLFSRLTSSLWGVLAAPAPPPPHPITAKFDALPKVEPWTKTHYKTLDALFQLHKRQPTLFAPASTQVTRNTNNTILEHFLNTHKEPFIGARYSVWGYSVTMTESLVVLCAVYMQLLVLKDIDEYERHSGKDAQMGDCNPGKDGEAISAFEVLRRLASVIMGEYCRRDEKKGLSIVKEGEMMVEWLE